MAIVLSPLSNSSELRTIGDAPPPARRHYLIWNSSALDMLIGRLLCHIQACTILKHASETTFGFLDRPSPADEADPYA